VTIQACPRIVSWVSFTTPDMADKKEDITDLIHTARLIFERVSAKC
jgi:hypothetical protein